MKPSFLLFLYWKREYVHSEEEELFWVGFEAVDVEHHEALVVVLVDLKSYGGDYVAFDVGGEIGGVEDSN